MNPEPLVMFSFSKPRDLDRWHVFTDAYFGGRSAAEWRWAADEVSLRLDRPGRLHS
jgi:hypothetical protein